MKPIIIISVLVINFLFHQSAFADSPPEGNYPFRLSHVKTGVPYSYPIGNDSINAFLLLVFDSHKAIDSAYVNTPDGQVFAITDTSRLHDRRVYYIIIKEADYHAEITVTVGYPGKAMEIETRSKTAQNKIQYLYAGGTLHWVQVGDYKETSAIRWSGNFYKPYYSQICYKSDAKDMDKKIFKRRLYIDSCFTYSSGGRLTGKLTRFGEIDSSYSYSLSGKLRRVSWTDKRTLFVYTGPPLPGFTSYSYFKLYNCRGIVVRLHYFDNNQDALIDIRYYSNGNPRRICNGYRETEECTWYRRNGSVRRTKSWERERYIHPVDWDFDIETLY